MDTSGKSGGISGLTDKSTILVLLVELGAHSLGGKP